MAQPWPSPCINICRMHPQTGWCEGCGRSLDDITWWSRMDEAAKGRVWALLPKRLHQMLDASPASGASAGDGARSP